jgi:hypothetical protein
VALNLGGVIRLTYDVRDAASALTNPTTATLTITQPDGTVAAGTTVTLPPSVTGKLVFDFTPTQAGLHSAHWATTVPTTAEDDVFLAERPTSLLVSVDEAVGHLRAAGVITSDSDREQLQWLCLVATSAVEDDLGRVVIRRTITETHDGGGSVILLRKRPVISIASVNESGVSLSAANYVPDLTHGLLRRGSAYALQTFSVGSQNVTISYVAGYADPPRPVREVALATVQALWQETQQASHPLLDESGEPPPISPAIGGLPRPLQEAYESLRVRGP